MKTLAPEERVFTVAFGISLGAHLLLIIGQACSLDWLSLPKARLPIKVVYQEPRAQQDALRVRQQLSRARREAASAPVPGSAGERVQIRIPDRPSLLGSQTLAELVPARAAERLQTLVDLTDLVDAARGDPVLLSYFSAIREEIQQSANSRAWLTGDESQGLVYVSFLLAPDGRVQQIRVMPDRSAASQGLQDAAVRIVTAAAPFPPLPPSLARASKTIVVPLEFILGS